MPLIPGAKKAYRVSHEKKTSFIKLLKVVSWHGYPYFIRLSLSLPALTARKEQKSLISLRKKGKAIKLRVKIGLFVFFRRPRLPLHRSRRSLFTPPGRKYGKILRALLSVRRYFKRHFKIIRPCICAYCRCFCFYGFPVAARPPQGKNLRSNGGGGPFKNSLEWRRWQEKRRNSKLQWWAHLISSSCQKKGHLGKFPSSSSCITI